MDLDFLRQAMNKASMAAGNVLSRERDREPGQGDGPKERGRQRLQAMVRDSATKLAISQGAQRMARWAARRLPEKGLGKLAHKLAPRPLASAGVALFAFDAARDGLRLARGQIDSAEMFVRSSGNAAGLTASAGGAVVGGAVGGMLLPVVGAPLGSLLGSMAAGVGGDAAGRHLAVKITARGQEAPGPGRRASDPRADRSPRRRRASTAGSARAKKKPGPGSRRRPRRGDAKT